MKQDSITLDDVVGMPKELQPYVRLWAEVMRIGVQDYCTARGDRRVTGKRDHRVHWFESNVVAPGSFVWLCHLFNIDENQARNGVLRKWRSLVDRKELRDGR